MYLTLVRLSCLVALALPVAAVQAQSPVEAQSTSANPWIVGGSWKLTYKENFEEAKPLLALTPLWSLDSFQNTDQWADGGSFFIGQGITPPLAYRIEAPFSTNGWLSVAAYSRSNSTNFNDLFSVVQDPANPAKRVVRVSSPNQTDGRVIRSIYAWPSK